MSGNIIEADDDGDALSINEIHALFPSVYNCRQEITANSKCYVLHITSSSEDLNGQIALALSDRSVHMHDAATFAKTTSVSGHSQQVTGVKFSASSPHILYTSSMDGTLLLWDLRKSSKPALSFSDKFENEDGTSSNKPLLCFDVDLGDRLLCAGTEQIIEDSFVLFWDIRRHSLLGGYWESHSDDITEVSFHKSHSSVLASTSLDGLINVFDVTKPSEADALQFCLNSESPVSRMKWISHRSKDNNIAVISDDECLQLWNIEASQPYISYSRANITDAMKRTSSSHCYIVGIHQTNEGLVFLCGSSSEHGCLRTLYAGNRSKELRTHSRIGDESSDITRSSYYFAKENVFLTGTETGVLKIWTGCNEEGW